MTTRTLVMPKGSLRNWILLAIVGSSSIGVSLTAVAAPQDAPNEKPCLSDLQSFDKVLQKDGYWVGGPGYGYGVPVFGYGYAYGGRYNDFSGYARGRPGYEVHTLVAAAHILAQSGSQTACEAVLSAARTSYTTYLTEVHKGQLPPADVVGWRRQQIETAVPVVGNGIVYRSDQLIGASVINGQNADLGNVSDILLSPQTGKIAYLVVAHGGVFGIDEKYSPVPWTDFKSVSGSTLLVLTVTKQAMDAAPLVRRDPIDSPAQNQKVDSYWSAHPPVAMN